MGDPKTRRYSLIVKSLYTIHFFVWGVGRCVHSSPPHDLTITLCSGFTSAEARGPYVLVGIEARSAVCRQLILNQLIKARARGGRWCCLGPHCAGRCLGASRAILRCSGTCRTPSVMFSDSGTAPSIKCSWPHARHKSSPPYSGLSTLYLSAAVPLLGKLGQM